jgi:uncharacterized SAM-binding protein YcdF (DUF218 family)
LLILVLIIWILLLRGQFLATKWLFSFLATVLFLLALFPVGAMLLSPLETNFRANPVLPAKVDGIVVLGGPENARLSTLWSQVELEDGAERFLAFMTMVRRFPEAKVVFSGGNGIQQGEGQKVYEVAKKLFEQQGLDMSRLIFELDSRNTFESATFSKKLARPAVGEKWILITSAFHMPRSIGVFCKAGWSTIPYPVDHRTSGDDVFRIGLRLADTRLALGLHEWAGLVAYYLTGKTTDLLPAGCS